MSQMNKIWVLGDGQLGLMLKHAGIPLGLDVKPVDINNNLQQPLNIAAKDMITAEREQWPETKISKQLSQHANFINGNIFQKLANRFTQKQLLDNLHIPTAPWIKLTQKVSQSELHQQLGKNIILKRTTGGYDGKGQMRLDENQNPIIPKDWYDHAIAEQAINFTEEVSLIGARTAQGKCHFYPLTLNYHQNGILMASIAPLNRLSPLIEQAQNMLTNIMAHLNYIGVMAMECFRVEDKLLVNELAPRVHNSGHWTQDGSYIDQFELHLRALCNLPIPQLETKKPTLMINLIGTEKNTQWLNIPTAKMFWYNKQVRQGRKVGHLNLAVDDDIESTLALLAKLLPSNYQQTLAWIHNELITNPRS